jgi:primosomal protein N' (replication factor Y)
VAGRAGRKFKQGKVIIQTSDPDNTIIQKVIRNDYEGMFHEQLAERQQFKYPPFYRLISLMVKHRDKQELDHFCEEMAGALRTRFGKRVLGPEYPVINRIKSLFLKTILLKIERQGSIASVKRQMQEIILEVKSKQGNKGMVISIDVDPM